MDAFTQWLIRRNDKNKPVIPDADRIVPLISAAGESGVMLSDLRGSMCRLEPEEFNRLVDALVGAGMVDAIRRHREVVLRVKSLRCPPPIESSAPP
jgi:hypothetical protein